MAAQKRGEKQPANLEPVKLKDAPIKDGEEPTNRRQALTVEYGSGRSETVTNSAGVSMTHDMSLFDCPWSGALHSYLNPDAPFAVDGGLCLPYQEIPFPFSVGIAPVANGQPFPNLVTPSPNWDRTSPSAGCPLQTSGQASPADLSLPARTRAMLPPTAGRPASRRITARPRATPAG